MMGISSMLFPTNLQVNSNLVLRPPRITDAEDLFALLESCRTYLRRWLPWVDEVRSALDFRHWVESGIPGEEYRWMIVYKGMIVGVIDITSLGSPDNFCELGYWLSAKMQGRGIVTKSCGEIINYAFGKLGLNRVQIRVATGNIKSRAIPERLGFTCEGILRQSGLVNGEYHDRAMYSLLASEWPQDV